MSEILTSMSVFQFAANLKRSGNRIPDAHSVKLKFLLIITCYLSKTENRTNSFHTIALSKGIIWPKIPDVFFKKNAGISKIKRALVVKGTFSETKHVCVLMCQI